MACTAVMDLKPIVEKFTLSPSKKSAAILCSFTGKYAPPPKKGEKHKARNSAEIELVITNRSGNRYLKDNISEIEAMIASGSLLRVTGTLRRMLYQDRNSGDEIDRLSLFAFDVTSSAEEQPILSIVQMEGGVRKVSDSEIYKNTGENCKVTFNLFSSPSGGNDKESYLTVYVNGFNDVADKVNRLNMREGSHVVASGKFEATRFGPPLCLILHDLSFAKRPTTEKE